MHAPDLIPALFEILVVLGAAVAVLVLCQRVGIPTVAGLLLTGVLIGPPGLGLVPLDAVEAFAEIGVMLLLFTIGLELSPGKLAQSRRAFLAGGPLQAVAIGGLTFLVAVSLGQPAPRALFLAFVLILSSTAVVLKIYDERGVLRAPHGEVALGVLLFQDLLLVPMIILTPILGGSGGARGGVLLARAAAAAAAVAVAFLLARVVFPFLLHHVVRTRVREVFVLSALALCLGMALLTYELGLSLALGAFLAGVAASQSEYHHQVMADIGPFRDVFISLFFVSIGMLVTLPANAGEAGLMFGLAAGIVVGKMFVMLGVVLLLGLPLRTAVLVGFGLAQIGEFSFVLLGLGRQFDLVPDFLAGSILTAAAATLLLTPVLIHIAPRVVEALPGGRVGPGPPVSPEFHDHVIVVGMGHTGDLLSRVLDEVGIRYVVIELSPEAVQKGREAGRNVLFGDATRPDILSRAGVEGGRVLVTTISDPPAVHRIIQVARRMNPHIHTIVRTRDVSEIEELTELGAGEVVSLEFESSIEIFNRTLAHYHIPRNIARAQTRILRGEGYRMLRAESLSDPVSRTVLEALDLGTTDVFHVTDATGAAGKTLRGLDLRGLTGATVIAVVRGDKAVSNLDADFKIEPGDNLVVVGDHVQVERAFDLLSGT